MRDSFRQLFLVISANNFDALRRFIVGMQAQSKPVDVVSTILDTLKSIKSYPQIAEVIENETKHQVSSFSNQI